MYKSKMRLADYRNLSRVTAYTSQYLDANYIPSASHHLVLKINRKLGNAVSRNLIKRRIKHIIRLHFATFQYTTVLIKLKQHTSLLTFTQLQIELNNLADMIQHD